ncbi:hypothetical protein HZA33_05110, partial [Candidatus Pacearchaeota archaeon]|nr:hypothetical protein [Candidatus Pacearchaeota archaeon]
KMRLITYEQVKDGTSMFNLIEDRDIGSDSLERRLQQNKQTLYRMIEQSLPEGYNYSKK